VWGIGESVDVTYWESNDLNKFNWVRNDAQLFVRYTFLMATTLSLVLRSSYVDYWNNKQFEAAPIRAFAALDSPITRWLGIYALFGYGNSIQLAAGRIGFNNAIAHLETRFFLPKGSRLTVGYDRDFFDSIFANFYTDDVGFITFDQPLVYRLMAHLDAGVRYRQYQGLGPPADYKATEYGFPQGIRHREDTIYDFRAELSVKATDWLLFAVSYNMQANQTGFTFCNGAPGAECGPNNQLPVAYLKHSAFLRADFAY
jgi:hypothetical protein